MKRSLAEKIKMLCVYGVLAIMTGTAATACSFPGSADILFGDTSSTGAGAEDDGTTSGAAGNCPGAYN